MATDERIRSFVMDKVSATVDISNLEAEQSNLKTQLCQIEGAKKKLMEQMDKLDVTDRHYNRKNKDMQDRLDGLCDRLDEIHESLEDVKTRMDGAEESKTSVEQISILLQNYGSLYKKMTDLEKKEFFHSIVERIELYPEYSPEGKILKHIQFKFPVCYDAGGDEYRLINGTTDEAVVLLSKIIEKPKTFFDISVEAKDYYRIKDRKKN